VWPAVVAVTWCGVAEGCMGGSVAVKMAVSLRLGAEVMAASTQVGAAVRPSLPLTPLPPLLPPLP
jgi:hypothetical protein